MRTLGEMVGKKEEKMMGWGNSVYGWMCKNGGSSNSTALSRALLIQTLNQASQKEELHTK